MKCVNLALSMMTPLQMQLKKRVELAKQSSWHTLVTMV